MQSPVFVIWQIITIIFIKKEAAEDDRIINDNDLKGASCCELLYSTKDGKSISVEVALSEVTKAWKNLLNDN